MANDLARLKEVPKVLASLSSLREEISSTQTYEDLWKYERAAEAIKIMWADVNSIKQRAEDVIIEANVRLGEELDKIPMAKTGPKIASSSEDATPGREGTGIPRNLRSQAGKLARAGIESVREAVQRLRDDGKDATPRAVATLVTQGDKQTRRAERERELGLKQRALPDAQYGVIYADPPWSFKPYNTETGMDRAADNHYPTMDVEQIIALNIPAAEDCVLFLWATVPMVPEALDVLLGWGFSYSSHICWVKDKAGTGFWNRNQHELLLIGTRGNPPAPAPGQQPSSVIYAPRGKHSAKPVEFYEIIEAMFPTLPKLEMFAREAREGWSAFGNEAPEPDAPVVVEQPPDTNQEAWDEMWSQPLQATNPDFKG